MQRAGRFTCIRVWRLSISPPLFSCQNRNRNLSPKCKIRSWLKPKHLHLFRRVYKMYQSNCTVRVINQNDLTMFRPRIFILFVYFIPMNHIIFSKRCGGQEGYSLNTYCPAQYRRIPPPLFSCQFPLKAGRRKGEGRPAIEGRKHHLLFKRPTRL